jgi:hypothetical protein
MGIELTEEAERAANEILVQPNIVVIIDGYPNVFAANNVQRAIRIGDPGLVIGDAWRIGGYTLLEGQHPYLMFSQGTTTKISQQIAPDRGQGSGISRMVASLIDKDEEVSKIISPGGGILPDIIGRKVKVMFGFTSVVYPQSYITVFRGIIEDVQSGAGFVSLSFNHIEDRKRAPIFESLSSKTTASLTSSSTTPIPVVSSTNFPIQYTGAPGGADSILTYFAKIDEEVIQYTSKSTGFLNGTITRGALGTVAAAHDSGADIVPIWRFFGSGMDIALKLMMSGVNGPYLSSVPITSILKISDTEQVENALFFAQIDADDVYGAVPGSWITVSGAANGANNFTNRQISEVVKTNDGSFIRVNGAPLVLEATTSAVISFRSLYDTIGVGIGLTPEDVDVTQHESIRDQYLASFSTMDLRVASIEDLKKFMDEKLFKVMACVSVPRQGKSSVVFHSPPFASDKVPTLDKSNIKNPEDIKIRRSSSSNFANSIVYDMDFDLIDEKFKKTFEYKDDAAIAQVGNTKRVMRIEADGLRTASGGESASFSASNRLLARYRIGASFFEGIRVLYGVGYNLQIGDIIMVDTEGLYITNFEAGDRSGKKSLMEIQNWSLDVPSAEITLTLVNTSFGIGTRFARWSPSSLVGPNSTTTRLNIKRSFSTKAWQIEGKKWLPFVGEKVKIRNYDWTFLEERTITSVYDAEDSQITVTPALSVAPPEDYYVEAINYPNTTDPLEAEKWKLLHVFWSPTVTVVSGASTTVFDVGAGDVSKFFVGSKVRIHNADFSIYSSEQTVSNITGTTITVAASLGITPSAGQKIELIGFKDEGESYRWI